ncbi:MAG: DUF3465 domain-containing protein [Methyloprofundus sp.]|nr:DUF3465 domain-containing protein [Methyloprofundus sp.]
MKKILIACIALGVVAFDTYQSQGSLSVSGLLQRLGGVTEQVVNNNDLQHAYKNKQSDIQTQGEGIVVKVLADDLDGSRHQKFILNVGSGQTALVAHNIDLAPRIKNLQKGDKVAYSGEYEWTPQGGVIHWTHADPSGHHAAGWLKHQGQSYQ